MRIKDIGGEFGLIDRIRETYSICQAPMHGLVVGMGDDAAVFDSGGKQVVVTTDMLVEGVHFRRDWSDFYSIGWKAAAVNLSDIAGMGAEPTFSFISLAFGTGESVENMDRLYDGFVDCLTRYGARLAGGDTNSTPKNLVLSVTQLGEVAPGRAFLRRGAHVGDRVLVTGTLGNSAAGLALLIEAGLPRAERLDKDLVNMHRRPQPRIVASRVAAESGVVRAAMDLSDGLAADLKKLCTASGVGARIDASAIPISDGVKRVASILHKDPVLMALQGGEDYELVFCVAPDGVDSLIKSLQDAGVPATVVGEITKAGFKIMATGGQEELAVGGWDHFTGE
jgi:thiamine-monophosphate kinase